MNWWFFILGVFISPFLRLLAHAINRKVIERRRKKFLTLVDVTFPDHDRVTLITIDTSDRRAMRKLEQELREKYSHIYEVE